MEARVYLPIIVLFTILFICFPSEARAPKAKRIAIMGDSIVYHAQIENRLRVLLPGYEIDNYGAPMNTPFDMKNRVKPWNGSLENKILDPCQYGTVIVLGGFNGIWRGNAIRGLDKLYQQIKLCPVKLIALVITPFGSYRGWTLLQQSNADAVNEWLLTKPPNVDIVLDVNSCISEPDNISSIRKDFTKDGLHINRKGGAAIADYLFQSKTL